MKFNKYIITAIAAAALGVLLGYLFFHKSQEPPEHAPDQAMEMDEVQSEIWTCSMHPQIRQDEPGQCPICGMDLIPLKGSFSEDPLVLQMTNEAVRLADVQTTAVGDASGSPTSTMRLTGKVKADERRTSSQVAHIPGRIERLFVTFTGEQVYQGQKLAELYSPELIAAQRELFEAIKLKDVSPSLLEAARAKLHYWKIDSTAIRGMEQRGEIQETFPLFASAAGVVTRKRVSVGDYVGQGEPLFDFVNLNEVWVLFDAYEEDLSHVSVGDKVEFTTPAVPGRTFSTRITFVDPVINPATRVASLRAEVGNARGLLKPEMLVYGLVTKRSLTDSKLADSKLTVPKSAVLWTGKRSVVYVALPDMAVPSFEFREITLGDALSDGYLVLEGLDPGERVVTHGSFAVDAAAQLNNQASMINRQVSLKGAQKPMLPDFVATTPEAFKRQLAELTRAYLALKDALVASDAEAASASADSLSTALAQVDMSLVTGEAHEFWMEQLNAVRTHNGNIASLEDLEQQRAQFEFVSTALIRTLRAFGVVGETTFYVQFCPMAFDNKGAEWISDEQQIRNPYFGDRMLTCGTTEDTITKDYRNVIMEDETMPPTNVHRH